MTVFTIGYEGLDTDTFMSLLKAHGIEAVVDIRELPLSRKPGFSKKALTGLLAGSGLNYVHMVELGCPKQVRDKYRQDGSWRRYTQRFLAHLAKQEAAILELSEMVAAEKCALLCFEADYEFCHRSMVAEAVRAHCGAAVKHISSVGAKTARAASQRLACA